MTRIFVRYHETAGPIVVERDGREEQARHVEILGPSRVVFRPERGTTRIWVETDAPVEATL